MNLSNKYAMTRSIEDWEPSYWSLGEHTGLMVAHIVLMVAAWCFILPIAVMLGVAHSRYTIPTQLLFLIVNALGIFLGIAYNKSTPDLYVNNAHHKIGWIATWVVIAQVVIRLIYIYTEQGRVTMGAKYHRLTFLPVSAEGMVESQNLHPSGLVHEQGWSGDSGRDIIHPTTPDNTHEGFTKPEDDELDDPTPLTCGWLRRSSPDRFFSMSVPDLISSRVLRTIHIIYNVIDRIILPFGFVVLMTGGITYGGIFRGDSIFNGLAHFIKGGIFVWYGLVVLGRYMGCWANFGWSWNIKPVNSRVVTGEFIESALIFTYGATNVFLEHLAGWGEAWTARDLEHVSISVMFFGAGLCGMLIESSRVWNWLNCAILSSLESADSDEESPKFSFNPMPALIIYILGNVLGGHDQEQMISMVVHRQWGNLLSGAALARGVTYALTYVKPPTSHLPSRPPSELVAAFCLISGGLIFMFSASDCIDVMVYYELDATFTFNVGVGFSCLIMAWEILVLTLKAWATQKK